MGLHFLVTIVCTYMIYLTSYDTFFILSLLPPSLSLSPYTIHQIWGTAAGSVWFVGDSIDDMVCGKLAGCRTCLILTDDNQNVASQKEYVDISVKTLSEFGKHIGLDL